MKNFFNRLNLNLLTINFLIIVVIPLNLNKTINIKSNNIAEGAYSAELLISLILSAVILSLILIFFSFLISKIAIKFNVYSIYSFLIGFLLLWIFLTGNFFPVSGLPGPFLNLDLSLRLRYIILLKIVLIFLIYLFLVFKDKKNFFFRLIYFYVLVNIVFLFLNIPNKTEQQKSKFGLNEFGNKNLIVLSFDGISGHKIYEEIINDKIFYQKLKDFKLYKDTVSGAPHTWPSINLEINGELQEDSSNNILDKKNINTLVYASYNTVLSDKSKGFQDGQVKNYNLAFEINSFFQTYLKGSIGRWATPVGIILLEPLIYTKTYINLINLISFYDNNKSNPYNFIKSPININLYEFDVIFDETTLNKSLDNVIRMYHFIFSHWPITVNENCEEIKSFDNSILSYEHESIILKCISKKITKFLDKLKKNKVYDNSMIVIKSDHAKPNCIERTHTKDKISDFFGQRECNRYYKEYPYTEKLNNNYYWGFGRYKPFILIKNQNQRRNEIEISNKQVFLHDLSSTYCNFFFNSKECDYLNKNNLVESEDQFSIYNYDIYIPKLEKPLSTTQFENLKKYTMSNDVTFLEFLKSNKINSSN